MLVAIAVFVTLIVVLLLVQYALMYSAWRHEVIERKHQRMKDRIALYDRQMERAYRRHIRQMFVMVRMTANINSFHEAMHKAERSMAEFRLKLERFAEMFKTVGGPET